MAQQKFTNNAVATLSASINSTATTITVASGQGALFPSLSAGEYFYATIIDSSNNIEIVKVTARSTDSLTVVRGQENTTARSYIGGDSISLRVTAAALTNFAAQDKNNTFSGTNTFSGVSTVTGSLNVPTQSYGNSSTLAASTAFVQAALPAIYPAIYPVGSIYINANVNTNPFTLFGFGTWEAFGSGRVMVGVDATNPLFDTVRETGGSADAINVSHTHTISGSTGAMSANASHSHTWNYGQEGDDYASGNSYNEFTSAPGSFAAGNPIGYTNIDHTHSAGSLVNSTVGSSGTNANLQPYITVYMWRRTA